MAHFIISVLCWLGLAGILGKLVSTYVEKNDKDKDTFAFIILNGLGAAIIFVPLLGFILAVLTWIIPSLETSVDFIFDIFSPFGLPTED